jgi:RNA polymerase primary sigma factor
MKKQEISEKNIQTTENCKPAICEETIDNFPIEFHSLHEISDLLDSIDDVNVEITIDQNFDINEQKLLDDLDEKEQNGKSENLVQTYFRSLGNISILKRDEEIELAKKMEEGKSIIKKIITKMPLFKKLES